MEATNYTSIGPVLQLNKAGGLTQKRMKAAKVCDGLYITEPDKRDFVRYIIECNDVMWVESTQSKSYVNRYAAMMPEILKKVKAGFYNDAKWNNFCREIDRRINHPEAPVIMELKKPERKKPAPLPEGAKKVSVYMCKGCTAETTDKKVVVTEVAPHVYTYTYKLKNYGERVKIIFEIDGVYFQGHDTGTYVLEREDFTEVCTKAYKLARQNVADGAASGMAYFIEVQKRIDAATPEQVDAPEVSAPQYDATAEVATKIMAYLPEVCKWQDDGDRTNALILKFMQPANAYHGFNGSDFVELAGLIGFTIEKKWRDRITKYVHTFQAYRAQSCPQQSGVYGDMYTRPRHDTMSEIYTIADAFMRRLLWLLERWSEEQPATLTETPQISTEAAKVVNVSAECEKDTEMQEMPQIFNCEWRTMEHFKEIPNIFKLTKAGIIINGVGYHTEYLDQAHNVLARVDNIGLHDGGKGFGGFQGSGVFGKTAIFKSWDNAVIAMIDALTDYLHTRGTEPPQSPEAPQTMEYATDMPETRKTPPNTNNHI